MTTGATSPAPPSKATLRDWVQASRPPFFVATLVPLGIGWIMAGREGGAWRPGWFVLVLLGSLMIHLATNLADDYFDHLQGADAGSSIGGSRVIQEGKISTAALGRALLLLYSVAVGIALWLMIGRNVWGISPWVLLALFSSIFYVGPPVRYGYRALGELFVGVNMGPIMLAGTYWVIAGHPSRRALLVSLPVGVLVASILYFQSLPDMVTDAAVGKRTLAVRLGRRGARWGLVAFAVAAWGGIVALVCFGLLRPVALLSLAGLPLAIRLGLIISRTEDWVLLDAEGWHVRAIYFISGLALMLAI